MPVPRAAAWVFIAALALLLIFIGVTGRAADLTAIVIAPSQLVVTEPATAGS